MVSINLGLIGFGNVGQKLSQIMIEKEDEWKRKYSVNFKTVAITTRNKGSLMNRTGIDLKRALLDLNHIGIFDLKNPDYALLSPEELTDLDFVDAVIEITTLNIEDGRPAADYIASALQKNKDVITTNKGPIAFDYQFLKMLAKKHNRSLLFEGTVMDCAPIFNLTRETLRGCKISSFRAILNSTTNYILTEMTKGITFPEALKKAQELGFAEADPSLDIKGWDSAAKVAILINVLLDGKITPPEIERSGIDLISMQDVNKAKSEGKVIRLLCEGEITSEKCFGRVAPVALDYSNPLVQIEGTSSLLILDTDLAGTISIGIENPQVEQTAYAIISDLFTLGEIRYNRY